MHVVPHPYQNFYRPPIHPAYHNQAMMIPAHYYAPGQTFMPHMQPMYPYMHPAQQFMPVSSYNGGLPYQAHPPIAHA